MKRLTMMSSYNFSMLAIAATKTAFSFVKIVGQKQNNKEGNKI